MISFDIIDIDLIGLLDPIDGLWGVWECDAVCSDGQVVRGTIQSDGYTWALETFEVDEDDNDPI